MVPAIRRWAIDSGVVDFPGERRANNRAIARAGGIAIFIPFIFSVLVYVDINREIRGVLAGSLLIFFTGLIDDLYQLSARQKFMGQISGCLVAVMVGRLYLTDLGNLFGQGNIILPPWAGWLFALFAMVGVINALNFIDGLDGLAGGLSVIALSALFWLALQDNNMPVLALCSGLLGGLLGFLKFNSFPARIFMGDAGSLVVGFLLGCIAILLTQGEGASVNAVVPLMILAVPIVDTLVVMLQRRLKGGSVLSADKAHLHHKIMQLGLDHSFTVFVIHTVALIWALAALVFQDSAEYILFAAVVTGMALMYGGINLLRLRKVTLDKSEVLTGVDFYPFVQGVDKVASYFIVSGMGFYGILAIAGAREVEMYPVFAFVVLLGLVACLCLCRYPDKINLFCFLSLFPVALVNFKVESFSDYAGNTWLLTSAGDLIFVVLALLVAVKFLLLKSAGSVLDVFFEFIIFAMALTLAVVSADLDAAYHLSGVLSKCIVAFLALKFLAQEGKGRAIFVVAVFNLSLVIVALS